MAACSTVVRDSRRTCSNLLSRTGAGELTSSAPEGEVVLVFSSDWIQEAVALGVAGLAAVALILRLLGRWPGQKPKAAPVQVGSRLARGLANRRR
jgi:hypothetical protein